MRKIFDSIWFGRVLLFFMALSLLLSGAATLIRGRLHYSNYWGGGVFAPLAIGIGVFLLLMLARKERTEEPNESRKKPTAKQRRKEEQAKRTKFPIDDFDKPWAP